MWEVVDGTGGEGVGSGKVGPTGRVVSDIKYMRDGEVGIVLRDWRSGGRAKGAVFLVRGNHAYELTKFAAACDRRWSVGGGSPPMRVFQEGDLIQL